MCDPSAAHLILILRRYWRKDGSPGGMLAPTNKQYSCWTTRLGSTTRVWELLACETKVEASSAERCCLQYALQDGPPTRRSK